VLVNCYAAFGIATAPGRSSTSGSVKPRRSLDGPKADIAPVAEKTKTAYGVCRIRRSREDERRRWRTTRSPEPTRPPIAHSFSHHGAEPGSRARSAERSEGTLDAGEHRGLLKGRWSKVPEAKRSGSFQVYLARH
jgi:hypothetical protein